jgi:hypothetical protein
LFFCFTASEKINKKIMIGRIETLRNFALFFVCLPHLASRLLRIFFFMSSRLLASLSLPMAIFLLNAEQERSKAKKRRSTPFIRTGAPFDHETYPFAKKT